jgi:hypothetical protein
MTLSALEFSLMCEDLDEYRLVVRDTIYLDAGTGAKGQPSGHKPLVDRALNAVEDEPLRFALRARIAVVRGQDFQSIVMTRPGGQRPRARGSGTRRPLRQTDCPSTS